MWSLRPSPEPHVAKQRSFGPKNGTPQFEVLGIPAGKLGRDRYHRKTAGLMSMAENLMTWHDSCPSNLTGMHLPRKRSNMLGPKGKHT